MWPPFRRTCHGLAPPRLEAPASAWDRPAGGPGACDRSGWQGRGPDLGRGPLGGLRGAPPPYSHRDLAGGPRPLGLTRASPRKAKNEPSDGGHRHYFLGQGAAEGNCPPGLRNYTAINLYFWRLCWGSGGLPPAGSRGGAPGRGSRGLAPGPAEGITLHKNNKKIKKI